MNPSKIALAFLAVASALSAGAAQARGAVDVHWQLVVGSPGPVYRAPIRVVITPPAYFPAPVFVAPRQGPAYRARTRCDVDGDGIPNRYDRVYNPRWDRDGDGIPNRHDRDAWHGHRQTDEGQRHPGEWRGRPSPGYGSYGPYRGGY